MSRKLTSIGTVLLAVLLVATAGRSLAQRRTAAVRMVSQAVIASLQSEPLTQSRFRPATAVAVPATIPERVEVVAARHRSGGDARRQSWTLTSYQPCPSTVTRRQRA